MKSRLAPVLVMAVLAGAYYAAGRLGLALAFIHESTSAVWPPTGIALAALVIFGRRAWPGVTLGAFLVNLGTAAPVPAAFIAAGNTLEAVLGAALIARHVDGAAFVRESRTFLRFTAIVAAAVVVSATVGTATLVASGMTSIESFPAIWIHWWLGDAAGALLITPMVLAWHANPRPSWTRAQAIEACVLLAAVATLAAVVFGELTAKPSAHVPSAFLIGPLLLWPACRFGPRETATATFLVAMLALAGTLEGLGPFASAEPRSTLFSLQAFLAIAATTSMLVAASTSERVRTTAALERYQRELEAANLHLSLECKRDALTGVLNRRGFEERLSAEVERARRHERPLALLIVDVDRFKRQNTALGHDGADAVLRTIASLLARQLRTGDYLARLGGDEFVALLPETDAAGARALAERCRRAIESHAWERRAVTVSIGAAAAETGAEETIDIFREADDALFRAKAAGRNVVVHSGRLPRAHAARRAG